METKAKRTLVKSAPELWELADDVERMEAWMAGLVGADQPVSVRVVERRPRRALAWRSERSGPESAIAVTMAEKGWGTSVSIVARHPDRDPAAAGATLERLLDELGSPERRPFERG